jgi:hypothetical protein
VTDQYDSHRRDPRQALGILLTAALLIAPALAGCGDNKGMVPVHGKVTYAGGPWPFPVSVTLVPFETYEGRPNRPGSARGKLDGTFVVSSFKEGDGVQPGKYHVRISCIDSMDFSASDDDLDFVPPTFSAQDVDVKAGQGEVVINYDIPLKKPLPKMRKNPNNWKPPGGK